MLVVVDVNVVLSALIKEGNCFEIFEANKISDRFEFIAPEFLLYELNNKKERLLSETNLSKEKLSEVLSFIKKQIAFIPSSDFIDKLPEASDINFKDSPYLALAIKFNCPILSGDKRLKEQTKVKILSPREALNILGIE